MPALAVSVLKVGVESWFSAIAEMEAMFPLHWEELGLNRDKIKMRCDRGRYDLLANQGMLHLVTARSDGKLVGYILGLLMPHAHYFEAGTWYLTDMYFVLPEYRRGAGLKMFVELERSIKALGVIAAVTSCKLHEDHTEFFEKLGWKWTDKTFVKCLKG